MKKNRTKIVFSDVSHLIVVLSAQKWICLNILETVDQLLQGMLSLLLRCDLSRSTSLVCSMNHISLSLRPSPKDDDDLKNTIFFGFHFTLCYQILNLKHLLRILKSSIFFPYTFHNYKFKIIAPPPKKKNIFLTLFSPLLLLSSKMAVWPLRIKWIRLLYRLWPMGNISLPPPLQRISFLGLTLINRVWLWLLLLIFAFQL